MRTKEPKSQAQNSGPVSLSLLCAAVQRVPPDPLLPFAVSSDTEVAEEEGEGWVAVESIRRIFLHLLAEPDLSLHPSAPVFALCSLFLCAVLEGLQRA